MYYQEVSRILGAELPPFPLDGNYHHFQDGKVKKSLWAIGTEIFKNGQTIYRITCGDFRKGTKFFWTNQDTTDLSKEDKRNLKEEQDLQRKRAQLENEKKYKECREKWYPIFNNLPKVDYHSYLKSKQIDINIIPDNIKKDKNGVLIIPIYNEVEFNGVQQIYNTEKNPENKPSFFKKFPYGTKMSGSFYCFGNPKDSFIYLAEGFSTAATIYQATGKTTICVFNSGNISHAIASLRKINPKSRITICADDDHELAISKPDVGNVGLTAAQKATAKIGNVIYKIPIFKNPKGLSDFNDLHCSEGIEEVKKQLEEEEKKEVFPEIFCLGYFGSTYYYSSNQNKQIISISASMHNKQSFIQLLPLRWWENEFGVENEKGGIFIDWTKVTSDLMEKCHKAGFWTEEKIRGLGVWKDQGTYFFNDGNIPLSDERKYWYEVKTPLNLDSPDYTIEDMRRFRKIISKASFSDKNAHMYFLAWIVQAQILTVLPWKFHIWITGETAAGKSWLQEFLEYSIINCQKAENSTLAGMQAVIGHDATPFIFDESEPTKNGILNVIQFAREASSPCGARKVRSNPAQQRIDKIYHTCLALGSIQMPELEPQDRNRFFVIETIPSSKSGQNRADFEAMVMLRDELLAYNIKASIFKRIYPRIDHILNNQAIINDVLSNNMNKSISRIRLQLSVMLACYWEFISEETISEEDILGLIRTYDFNGSDYVCDSQIDQAQELLDVLMSTILSPKDGDTLALCIEKIRTIANSEHYEEQLGKFGMRYFSEDNSLFIASVSSGLKKKLDKYPDYSSIFRRSDLCIKKYDRQRIPSFNTMPPKGFRIKV